MWALIPMKSLQAAKSRLASVLNAQERRELVIAMLQDVLEQAIRCEHVRRVAVVTADASVAHLLRNWPVHLIDERMPRGHSHAVQYACAQLKAVGARRVVVLSADIPTVDAGELAELIRAGAPSPSVVVAADRHGSGSNGLSLSPPDAIRPRFGTDSLRKHCEAAAQRGVRATTLQLHGLALDIDVPADLAMLLDRHSSSRSSALLNSWDIANRVRRHAAQQLHTAAGG